jgi:hydroxyacylglutathione hydrolase
MSSSVKIDQFFLGCLAHASYLVSSEGRAAVIDPQRDVEIYLDAARQLGVTIEHVIETHLHADFVSGHHELAQRTGAKIYLGDGSGAQFPHVAVRTGDSMQFGSCRMEFLQTPGHTLESVCILMTDIANPEAPKAVFSGDTLFVGDVGRPDLSGNHTPQELAGMLYTSLHERLMTLPDDTVIYPAHGAGSLCGRQMSTERSSTIGRERRTNYALLAGNSDEFIRLLTDSLPPRPEYFGRDVELNRLGAGPLDHLPAPVPIRVDELRKRQAAGAVVLDTRPVQQFAVAHVPGSIHIALSGQFASWAGRLLGLDHEIVLVGEDADHLRESQLRLARVGIEKVQAYLEDGILGWVAGGYELDYIPQVTVEEFEDLRANEPVNILDVREAGEVAAAAMEGSVRIPLGQLPSRIAEVPTDKLLVVHCKGGYRSSVATSLLRRAGVRDLANLTGGFDAWTAVQKAATASH